MPYTTSGQKMIDIVFKQPSEKIIGNQLLMKSSIELTIVDMIFMRWRLGLACVNMCYIRAWSCEATYLLSKF